MDATEGDRRPRVMIERDGTSAPRVTPAWLELNATTFGMPDAWRGAADLHAPPGWHVEPLGALRWRVRPGRIDFDAPQRFRVTSPNDERLAAEVEVRVDLALRSALDVRGVVLPQRNRATELGEVDPSRAIFDRTFRWMPEPLRRLLFTGIYGDIVFLHSQGRRGGLCSGMARWTLARALGDEPEPRDLAHAVERIQLYHGRQMKDRALLSAAPWFLRGSPRAAFRAVRDDLLATGRTDRALDIAVPKLWRRDLASALVGEGHTVVPYELRQEGVTRGEIEVYDPNHPGAVDASEPRVIALDLVKNRYAYGKLVAPEQRNVGIIAVRQRAYEGPGTALLATLGSLLFNPRRGWRALRNQPLHPRGPQRASVTEARVDQ